MKFNCKKPLSAIFAFLTLLLSGSCAQDDFLDETGALYDAPNLVATTTKTITLTPIQDAHLTGNTPYNLPIVGVAEGNRVAHLMFDLSKVEGQITSATLQYTIKDNPGNGKTRVFTGTHTSWTETNLTSLNRPKASQQLGYITKSYPVGSTHKINLVTKHLVNEKMTIIMWQEDGQGYTFASRETATPPKLIITTTSGSSIVEKPVVPVTGVKASSFGYNATDASKALRAAINSSNSTIIVDKQAGDWVIEPMSFNGLRNKTIVFEDGVVLRAKNGSYGSADRLFQLLNSSNVEIIGYGATFKMNRSYHKGEQNHLLSIVSSSDITVKGLTLRDAGGDGIYISRYRDGEYCRNIQIQDVISTNNQRQGMSVISVDGLVVMNSTFSLSNGKSPGAGIDFEGESIRDRFMNITFENCIFRDNNGPGMMTALSKSSSSSIPLDITLKNSYFTNNSRLNTRAYPTEIELGMCTNYRDNPIKGTITFDGLTVENSRWGAIHTKKTAEAYKVVVKNANFKNISTGSTDAAIHIGVLSYANKATANMGGFTFENVTIDYDGVDPSLQLFGPGHNNWNLKDIHGEIKVRSPRGIRLSDNMNKLATTTSSSVTLKVVKY